MLARRLLRPSLRVSRTESTAITDLIRLMTTRRVDATPRDSEPTLIVQRTTFVPYAHLPAPRPAAHAVAEPTYSMRVLAAMAATAIALGVLLGVIVSVAT